MNIFTLAWRILRPVAEATAANLATNAIARNQTRLGAAAPVVAPAAEAIVDQVAQNAETTAVAGDPAPVATETLADIINSEFGQGQT